MRKSIWIGGKILNMIFKYISFEVIVQYASSDALEKAWVRTNTN